MVRSAVCPKILATSCLSSPHHLIRRCRRVKHLDGKLVDSMVGGRRLTAETRWTPRQATLLGPVCCGFVGCGKGEGELAQAAGWPCFVVVLWAVAKEQAGWRRRQNGPALLWFCGLWQKSRQARAGSRMTLLCCGFMGYGKAGAGSRAALLCCGFVACLLPCRKTTTYRTQPHGLPRRQPHLRC